MPLPRDYRRHQHITNGSRRILLGVITCAVAFGMFATISWVDPTWASGTAAQSAWQRAVAFGKKEGGRPGATKEERRIYPYSIVAGGMHNKREMERALKDDPVVAAHYASFNVAKFHVVKLQHPEYAYVSFRVGDNVYWTNHKMKLRRGEKLITDGSHFGRTRCGNRVSQTPRLPTYIHEPTAKEMNTAARPRVRTEAFTTGTPLVPGGNAFSLAPPGGQILPPPAPRTVPAAPLTPYFAFLDPIAPTDLPAGCPKGEALAGNKCLTNSTQPSCPADETLAGSTCVPVSTPTPEDNTRILFLTGAVMLGGFELNRRRHGVRTQEINPARWRLKSSRAQYF